MQEVVDRDVQLYYQQSENDVSIKLLYHHLIIFCSYIPYSDS